VLCQVYILNAKPKKDILDYIGYSSVSNLFWQIETAADQRGNCASDDNYENAKA